MKKFRIQYLEVMTNVILEKKVKSQGQHEDHITRNVKTGTTLPRVFKQG